MSFDHLMQSFANQQQLGDLELRDHHYYLTIDTQMELSCFQANGKFYVYGVISMLPGDSVQREEFLEKILQKNLVLMQTERISLCIEPDKDVLGIYFTRPLQGLTEQGVEAAIAVFTNNFEFFLRQLGLDNVPVSGSPMMFLP